MPSAYSAGVKVFEKAFLQAWQKNSCWDMVASVPGSDIRILGSTVDLIQTSTAIYGQNWFIMAESCLPFRMAPSSPWMYWTASLSRNRATSQAPLAFDVRFVVGRRVKTICGHVAALMSGTHSIQEEYCPACLHQWTSTQCLSCSGWSPHSDWYSH